MIEKDMNRETNVDSVLSTFGFSPPYTVEQILQIESVKTSIEYEESDKLTECKYCLRPESSNPLSQIDKFLICVDCGNSAHPYCLKYSPSFVENVRQTKWQCLDCKQCSVCLQYSQSLVLCEKCDRGFHKDCSVPRLIKRPKGQFICHVCKEINKGKEMFEDESACGEDGVEDNFKKVKKIKKLILNTGRKAKFIIDPISRKRKLSLIKMNADTSQSNSNSNTDLSNDQIDEKITSKNKNNCDCVF